MPKAEFEKTISAAQYLWPPHSLWGRGNFTPALGRAVARVFLRLWPVPRGALRLFIPARHRVSAYCPAQRLLRKGVRCAPYRGEIQMDYMDLHLENKKMPGKAERVAQAQRVWSAEAAPGIYLNVWNFDGKTPHFFTYTPDKAPGLKYGVLIDANRRELRKLCEAATRPAEEYDLLDYVMEPLDAHPILGKIEYNGLVYNDAYYLWLPEGEKQHLPLFLEELSAALRSLAQATRLDFALLAAEALEDEEAALEYIDTVLASKKELPGYENLFADVGLVIQKWGVVQECQPLLALLGCLPGRGVAFAQLCAACGIPAYLEAHPDDAESLFLELQQAAENDYLDGRQGVPTVQELEASLTTLAFACNALGYGVHPQGLKAIVQTFENDAVAGISLGWYQSGTPYDAKAFGYYDGEENEGRNEAVWREVDVDKAVAGAGIY